MKETCASCRCWVKDEGQKGACHRYAPSCGSRWSTTHGYEWCAEYQQRAAAPVINMNEYTKLWHEQEGWSDK
jgi:hypothetical protein